MSIKSTQLLPGFIYCLKAVSSTTALDRRVILTLSPPSGTLPSVSNHLLPDSKLFNVH